MSGAKERRTDEGYEVYCRLDVGKSEHHAAPLNAAGERVFDKPLPQDEARLRELFTDLQQHGRVLVIVDQPNTIGALPIAVARDCGCTVAYLPGPAMRKAADVYPGQSKTDARDAFIIAETACAMPHTLRGRWPGQRGARGTEGALRIRRGPDPRMHQGDQPAAVAAAADLPRPGARLPGTESSPWTSNRRGTPEGGGRRFPGECGPGSRSRY
jgi:hypothetical protein